MLNVFRTSHPVFGNGVTISPQYVRNATSFSTTLSKTKNFHSVKHRRNRSVRANIIRTSIRIRKFAYLTTFRNASEGNPTNTSLVKVTTTTNLLSHGRTITSIRRNVNTAGNGTVNHTTTWLHQCINLRIVTNATRINYGVSKHVSSRPILTRGVNRNFNQRLFNYSKRFR